MLTDSGTQTRPEDLYAVYWHEVRSAALLLLYCCFTAAYAVYWHEVRRAALLPLYCCFTSALCRWTT